MRTAKLLGPGDYFGEISLIYRSKRTATVCAATFADLSMLHANDFEAILNQNPEFAEIIEKNFEMYLKPSGPVKGERRLSHSSTHTPRDPAVDDSGQPGSVPARRQSLSSGIPPIPMRPVNSQLSMAGSRVRSPGPGSQSDHAMPLPTAGTGTGTGTGSAPTGRRGSLGAPGPTTARRQNSFMRKLQELDKYGPAGYQRRRSSAIEAGSLLVPVFISKLAAARQKSKQSRATVTSSDRSSASVSVTPASELHTPIQPIHEEHSTAQDGAMAAEVLSAVKSYAKRASRVTNDGCNAVRVVPDVHLGATPRDNNPDRVQGETLGLP